MQQDNFQPMPWSIKYIAGILVALELLLQASDLGLLPIENLRDRAFIYGAFWPGLWLYDLGPVYPGQKFVMFLSHAFLHGSLMHMALNTVVIVALGKRLANVLSEGQLLLLFGGSAMAGGVVYLALSSGNGPMVGASGAVFGFFGTWKYFEYLARKRMGLSLVPVWQFIGVLVLLNVATWFMLSGLLAWQAHLGGFIAGWLLGMVFARKTGQARPGSHR